MSQGIYWVSTYLKYNLDKPPKVAKPTKQQEYRELLLEILKCYDLDEYPTDIQQFIDEIHRVLALKSITKKHIDKIRISISILAQKYR